MNPALISVAISILTNLLQRAGEQGDLRPEFARVYALVKEKLNQDPYLRGALLGFEDRPDSSRRRLVLEQAVAESAETDAVFSRALEQAVRDAAPAEDVRVSANGMIVGNDVSVRALNIASRDLIAG